MPMPEPNIIEIHENLENSGLSLIPPSLTLPIEGTAANKTQATTKKAIT